MCTVLLPPGGYQIAVNKYIMSYHIISYHDPKTPCEKNVRRKNCGKKSVNSVLEGKTFFEKPRKRQLENAANDLKIMDIRWWTKMARDRDAWK